MNKACVLCRGACCRSCIVYLGDGGNDLAARDAVKFVKLHGEETPVGTRFEAKCSMLNDLGLCAIYEDRPNVCRLHWVGCENCLQCIDRYHSADMAKTIKASFTEEVPDHE